HNVRDHYDQPFPRERRHQDVALARDGAGSGKPDRVKRPGRRHDTRMQAAHAATSATAARSDFLRCEIFPQVKVAPSLVSRSISSMTWPAGLPRKICRKT